MVLFIRNFLIVLHIWMSNFLLEKLLNKYFFETSRNKTNKSYFDEIRHKNNIAC